MVQIEQDILAKNNAYARQNRQNLERRGVTVLAPMRTSPGGASMALGQAWVAMNYLETNECV